MDAGKQTGHLDEAASPREGGAVYVGCMAFAGLGGGCSGVCDTLGFPADVAGVQLCLTIGALGWGQIQIANSNEIKLNPGYSRRGWMIELCDTLLDFYPKEIAKIDGRIKRFEKIKAQWQAKTE